MQVNFNICKSGCSGGRDPAFERQEQARTTYNIEVHELRGDAGFSKDSKAAFLSMEKAANMDYAPAQVALGLFYKDGILGEVNLARAAEWFDRAADLGNAQAFFQLGRLYESGGARKPDPEGTLRMYLRAAEKNLPEAECAAGLLLETETEFLPTPPKQCSFTVRAPSTVLPRASSSWLKRMRAVSMAIGAR